MEHNLFDLVESVRRLEDENRQLRNALDETECGRAMARQYEEFSYLLEASKRIISELDQAKVFELVAHLAREIVNAELVMVPMLSETRDRYTYAAAAGDNADSVLGATFAAGVGMCGWVLRHERSLLFGEGSGNWMDEKTTWEEGQQSAVLVPLMGRTGIIGGLSALGKRSGGCFTQHDLDLLTLFSNQVSTAIENALLFQQQRSFEVGLRQVNDCFLSFGSDARENIKAITQTAGEILQATCTLYNRMEGELLVTQAGWRMPPDMELAGPGEGRLCFEVISRGGSKPMIVRHLQKTSYAESDPNVRRYGLELYVGYPVKLAERTVGALCAVFQEDKEVPSYQLSLLGVLGKAISVEEERMFSEQTLRLSETRFRTIIEHAPIGIIAVEAATGNFLYVNPVICQMLGYSDEELRTVGMGSIHPESELDRIRTSFQRHEGLQTYCRRRDGTEFPVDIKAVLIELEGVTCLVGFFTDTTERQLLHEEQQKTQKLESVGTLAGGIAHDFNNLLQGIFGYVSIAKMSLDGTHYAHNMLDQAETALYQAVGLTNQLLTFSKGGKPVKRRLEPRLVIEKSSKFALSGSNSECLINVPDDLWSLEADEGQMGQVIQNIVLNASQAMPGGGTIRITAGNTAKGGGPLPLGLAEGNYVFIEIEDAGPGIPEQHIHKIFDPYFTTKQTGSGLGLATAYSIVKNHGGLIDVRTQPGKGTTFTVYLPAVTGRLPGTSGAGPALSAPDRQLRILLMDDEEALRNLSREMIGVLGHSVDAAQNGEEALGLYRESLNAGKRYDVVILDLTVRGGMGGVETVGKLLEMDPTVNAIVSSGYSDEASLADHLSHGFKAYLKKPYNIAELREILG